MQLPAATAQVTDLDERIQDGDLIYDDEDEEFFPATRRHFGEFVSQYVCVVRPDPKPRRIQRFRK